MERICDLHTHSHFSDGTMSPTQLIYEAEHIGLSAIALCDHNTVLGLPEFMAAARGREVEAVPGAEFSTDYGETELHILGLYIEPRHYPAIMEMMAQMQRRKEQSNIELIQALNQAGYALDYEWIKAGTPAGQVNRALIAAALMERGYVGSIQEAFKKLLSPRCGYYRQPKRIDAFEMIAYIKSIGAVAVLAHPFLNLKDEASLRNFLGPAKEAGLDGMETRYPRFDTETTQTAIRLAQEFELLESGGSDFHGANKPDIQLGTGTGTLTVPLRFLEPIRRAAGGVSASCEKL